MNYVDGIKIDLEKVSGKAGEVKLATAKLLAPFRGEKLVAKDTREGLGTRIRAIYVDGKSLAPSRPSLWRRFWLWLFLRPWQGGMPTLLFAETVVGNGLALPTCTESLAVVVEFVDEGEWFGYFLGKAQS